MYEDKKTVTISLKMSEEERDKLTTFCKANELNMSQVIRRSIREFLLRQAAKRQ